MSSGTNPVGDQPAPARGPQDADRGGDVDEQSERPTQHPPEGPRPGGDLPAQYTATRRFTLGAPRDVTVAPGGDRVVFLRSPAGTDPVTSLWVLDVATGAERLIVDAAGLDAGADLPVEERRRRERVRESAGGIVAYATDAAVQAAVFTAAGRLFVARLGDGDPAVGELPAAVPVSDPRVDPTGTHVAYVSGGTLRVIGVDGGGDRPLAEPDGPQVVWGLAEHVAGESMGRHRGYWWAPDGSRVLVARVDQSRVQRWWISDPADPASPPRSVPYPAAGTANADVSLHVIGLDGARVPVRWDRVSFEYLVTAVWDTVGGLLVVVQSRDQQILRLLQVDPTTGSSTVRREDTDPAWVTIVAGTPAVTASGGLVWTADVQDTRRLLVDGTPVTPPGLQVHAVCGVDDDTVLFTAADEPTEIHLWSWSAAGGLTRLSREPGVHSGQQAGGTLVHTGSTWTGTQVTVHRAGQAAMTVTSHAATPVLTPRVRLSSGGDRRVRTAVLLPSGHVPGSARLPVLMDPYGGPAGQRVLAARDPYLLSQWFAEQGFAVVVADGRGTPGRGPAWERTIHHDIAGPPLVDQVSALHAAAADNPDLDLNRVAIRGWSYGGYLAALAVLRRPDVFHAAVAGAPPTDHRLYDTHWRERYLGHPDEHPEVYDRCSLITDAHLLRRPLMLVHGLADDNVAVANTLRLSTALLTAARSHTVLPLSGVTHMANSENLLLLELDFLQRALRA